MTTPLASGTLARGASYTAPAYESDGSRQRVQSVDVIRGVVMVLMAIDHVRVFSGVPAGGPTPGVFFTRWITHFCAPAFIFLAGTSIYLQAASLPRATLARRLLIRGAWLVLLELTVLRVAWTFNVDYAHYVLAGVIWCIGWCMILMAGLIYLPTRALAAFGIGMIALHNLLDPLLRDQSFLSASPLRWLWQVLYAGGVVQLGSDGPPLAVLYSVVPWIGVMAAGYAFGAVLRLEPARRDRLCFQVGGAAIILFVALRALALYGDPRPWRTSGPWLSFLNTNKYPASLLFLLMTLGPTIALMPLAERARGRLATVLDTFGRVPFFFYVLHIPLIHTLAVIVSLVRDGAVSPWLFANHPMFMPPAPPGYMYGLPLLYAVWLVAIAILYPLCRWYAGVKRTRSNPVLRYL